MSQKLNSHHSGLFHTHTNMRFRLRQDFLPTKRSALAFQCRLRLLLLALLVILQLDSGLLRISCVQFSSSREYVELENILFM